MPAAALSHGHGYDSTFYATAATVIPILFLSLTLQGDFVMRAMLTAWRFGRASMKSVDQSEQSLTRSRVAVGASQYFLASLLGFVPFLVLVAGVNGEVNALLALERQRASASDQSQVMTDVVVLLFAALLALIVRFLSAVIIEHKTSTTADATATDKPAPTEASTSEPPQCCTAGGYRSAVTGRRLRSIFR